MSYINIDDIRRRVKENRGRRAGLDALIRLKDRDLRDIQRECPHPNTHKINHSELPVRICKCLDCDKHWEELIEKAK